MVQDNGEYGPGVSGKPIVWEDSISPGERGPTVLWYLVFASDAELVPKLIFPAPKLVAGVSHQSRQRSASCSLAKEDKTAKAKLPGQGGAAGCDSIPCLGATSNLWKLGSLLSTVTTQPQLSY